MKKTRDILENLFVFVFIRYVRGKLLYIIYENLTIYDRTLALT